MLYALKSLFLEMLCAMYFYLIKIFASISVRRISLPLSPLNYISNNDSRLLLSTVVDCIHYPPCLLQAHHQISTVKTMIPKLAIVCASPAICSTGELHMGVDDGKATDPRWNNQSKTRVVSSHVDALNNKVGVVNNSESLKSLNNKIHKERIRRAGIGLANKGKVPWNKGKKHSAETCERIRQRTLEALRDPKVKKKMSEHARPHSDETKAKISYSLRLVWQERLKSKKLKEMFFLSWAKSIAIAAKKGGSGQEELTWDSYNQIQQQLVLQKLLQVERKVKEKCVDAGAKKFMQLWTKSIANAAKKGVCGEQELDWDSYDKIREEMVLQSAAEKAKAKEIARIKAEKAAQIKAIKKVMLTQKRNEREGRKKAGGYIKSYQYKKAREDKDDLEVVREFKLNQKIAKIHVKEETSDRVSRDVEAFKSPLISVKLDLDLIKREKMRKKVSLADQIRDARDRRLASTVEGSPVSSDISPS